MSVFDPKRAARLSKADATNSDRRTDVTLGFDPCVWILPESSWEAWLKKVRSMPQLDPAVRKLTRHMVGNAQECEIDRLGRIHLSAPIRAYAGIDKDVVVMGMIDAVEIWAKDRFEQRQASDLEALNNGQLLKATPGIL